MHSEEGKKFTGGVNALIPKGQTLPENYIEIGAGKTFVLGEINRYVILIPCNNPADAFIYLCSEKQPEQRVVGSTTFYNGQPYKAGMVLFIKRPGTYRIVNLSASRLCYLVVDATGLQGTTPWERCLIAKEPAADPQPAYREVVCDSQGRLRTVIEALTETPGSQSLYSGGPSQPTAVSVTAAGVTVMASNASRKGLLIVSRGDEPVDLFLNVSAGTFGNGVGLFTQGASFQIDEHLPYTGAVTAKVAGATGGTVSVLEIV
jgi:hypothetical protein